VIPSVLLYLSRLRIDLDNVKSFFKKAHFSKIFLKGKVNMEMPGDSAD